MEYYLNGIVLLSLNHERKINMAILNTINFIEEVYDTYSVYHSLIVYDPHSTNTKDIQKLVKMLHQKDFPIIDLSNEPFLPLKPEYEQRFRLYVISVAQLKCLVESKNSTLASISMMFCINKNVFLDACKLINSNSYNYHQDMHLFSC